MHRSIPPYQIDRYLKPDQQIAWRTRVKERNDALIFEVVFLNINGSFPHTNQVPTNHTCVDQFDSEMRWGLSK